MKTDPDTVFISLKKAMSLKPGLVWVLSDGLWDDVDEKGMRKLAALAKAQKMPINTAFFGGADAHQVPEVLWDIAQMTGGKCILDDGSTAENPHKKQKPAPDTQPSIFDK